MESMGFKNVSLNSQTGQIVMDAVAKKISDLQTTKNGGSYSELLKQMQANALRYFKSQFQAGKGIADGLHQIQSALERLTIQPPSGPESYGTLKKHVEDLLLKAKSFKPVKRLGNEPEEQGVGNAAEHAAHGSANPHGRKGINGGSTVTIGSAPGGVALLGGGGAALYFLNVGGIKTLITGVP